MVGKGKPDCVKCGWVPVIDENIEFIYILNKYSMIIGNGFGGIYADSLRYINENEDIDMEVFIKKLNIYISQRDKGK